MSPYFYFEGELIIGQTIVLPTDASKHIVVVLRMKEEATIVLVNGKGARAFAKIVHADKYKCQVQIETITNESPRTAALWMAVGFTKNRNRNEWFLEKLVEIGVDYIIPLHCQNSERDKMNYERMQQVMAAAMIQSQRTYLPIITEAMSPAAAVAHFQSTEKGSVLIAHCEAEDKKTFYKELNDGTAMVLIGPEGDFSKEEIAACLLNGAVPVSLGPARLRTETAVVYTCSLFNQRNYAE